MGFLNKPKIWLLPAVIVLFVLEILTLPLVISLTYAGKSESPEHVITYRTGKLTWDENTKTRADGSGELTLFDAVYQNVKSDNGENVLAPGTEGDNIIRLKNECGNRIEYTVTLYTIRSVSELPVIAGMDGDGSETDRHVLPSGVGRESAVKSLHGTLEADRIADFNIDWRWAYERGNEQDIIDTALGDKAADDHADNIIMGAYIVVEDQGSNISPNAPKTGDDMLMYSYLTFMGISFVFLVLLLIPVKKRKADKNKGE